MTIHVRYVHGFRQGDADERNHPFYSELTSFFYTHRLPVDVEYWHWNSPATQPLTAFHAAVQETENAGSRLHEELREWEAKGEEYHLIGFSLGAAVIRQALALQGNQSLQHLRTIFFLGAAFPHDAAINDAAISSDTYCYNYFSSAWSGDMVLKFPYRMATGTTAAGEVGLCRLGTFHNYKVRCTHGMGIITPQWMAEPIGYLMAWHAGAEGEFQIPGQSYLNLPFWINLHYRAYRNDILQFNNHIIQQVFNPMFPGRLPFYGRWWYRAVGKGRTVERTAWAHNLHAVLREIGCDRRSVQCTAAHETKKKERQGVVPEQ